MLKHATREAWLEAAVTSLNGPVFAEAGVDCAAVRVRPSVGFPRGSRKAIGQCWDGSLSADTRPHLFISPVLADPVEVLATLAHELTHAVVGTEHKHKGPFGKVARAIGLEGKLTATVAGDALRAKLKAIAEELGDYPHAALVPNDKARKPGSRLRLWVCECEEPVKVRVAKDDFDATCNLCNMNFKPGEAKPEEPQPE